MSRKKTQIVTKVSPEIDEKALYRALLLPRLIEEKMLRLIRQNKLAKWFSGYGQEAIAVGCTYALEDTDVILPMHRNLGVWTTRGVPLKPLFCQLQGKAGGYTKGRDRTFHFGLPSHHLVGMISHLAAMLPVACGIGLGVQLKQEKRVALAFVGEGATREGDFHEALNLAQIWKLPVIFVIENNGYGLSTPTKEALATAELVETGKAYGMRAIQVEGNDVLAVIEAVQEASLVAKNGEGPTLLEMKTFRMRGHEEASGTKYVPPELIEAWATKDPVERFTQHVLENNILTEASIETLKEQLTVKIEEAVSYAFAQPHVKSTLDDELKDVFAPAFQPTLEPNGNTSEKRFIDGITEGLHQAMALDEKILIMGQDIAEYGGVFKVTNGFLEQFGKERVRNTPIIESGILGAGMGLALEGFKPVIEIQYADFISCGFNQIVNNLATTHYRWGSPLNVTVRAPFGGHIGAGPFHSQSPEAWFCHVPGLKVVIPATPHDAKGLLLTAVQEPNPVLFFEHKFLYRNIKGLVPDAPYQIPFGKATVARSGDALTLVTYGIGVHWAITEANYWETQGVSIEVIDLRTLVPWDEETVLQSLQKTNRLLVLHEATQTAGFGAEVASQITEKGFHLLDAPPVRVASEDLPVPFTQQLEKEIFSAQAKLRAKLGYLLAY